MKRFLAVLAIVLVVSTGSLWAQDAPKAEVYGGFSMVNISDSGFKTTPFGWAASANFNVNEMFGIVADTSGNYRDGNKFHSILGGVQLTHRVAKTSAFFQAKTGFLHTNDTSDNNHFQVGFGGGADWNVNDKVAIRLIQVDWLPTKETGAATGWVKNVTRASAGVVFKVTK